MKVKICVGSSCHLKGAEEIVDRMREAIESARLEERIELSACFCAGRCNRVGVTAEVDGKIYEGITAESFPDFFREKILERI